MKIHTHQTRKQKLIVIVQNKHSKGMQKKELEKYKQNNVKKPTSFFYNPIKNGNYIK
jgi:hypothetical protein